MAIVAMRRSQIAPEVTPGLAVAPTRQLAGALSLENQPERVLRDERRASMGGPSVYEDLSHRSRGSYAGRALPNELPYFLSAGIGKVTPVTAGTVQTWTYTQPLTFGQLGAMPLLSLTGYVGDEAESFRAAGIYAERLVFSGQDRGDVTVAHDLQGRELVAGIGATDNLSTALDTPANVSLSNLIGSVFIDDTGATIGNNKWTQTVFGWAWTYTTGIVLEYTMDLSLEPTSIQRDVPTATLELVAKLNATSAAEYAKYHDLPIATRFIRVDTYGPEIIVGTRYQLRIDGAYVCTAYVPLDQERDGTTIARITYTAVEDVTWGKKTVVEVKNTLGTTALDAADMSALATDDDTTTTSSRKRASKNDE